MKFGDIQFNCNLANFFAVEIRIAALNIPVFQPRLRCIFFTEVVLYTSWLVSSMTCCKHEVVRLKQGLKQAIGDLTILKERL